VERSPPRGVTRRSSDTASAAAPESFFDYTVSISEVRERPDMYLQLSVFFGGIPSSKLVQFNRCVKKGALNG
jgi:hypothetical protein